MKGIYKAGDEFTLSIERTGQSVTVKLISGETVYMTTTYDFDFLERDPQYMYIGMFANRGTVVEFTNVEFSETGSSQGA